MTAFKSLPDTFDAWVNELLLTWGVPGVAVGIVQQRPAARGTAETASSDCQRQQSPVSVEFKNYGTAGKGRAVTEKTLFGIASNTKAMTAAALGQLIEKGVIPSWQSRLCEVEPGFQLGDDYESRNTTIVDALSHQTGLPRHEHSYCVGQTTGELVRRMRGLRRSADLRTEWQYNNQMFVLAAHIVAQKSGAPFTTYVEESLFRPLGMTSSTFTPLLDGEAVKENLSSSFVRTEDDRLFEIPYGFNGSKEEVQFNAGAGGVVSCTADMVKWLQALITQRRRADTDDSTDHALDAVVHPRTVKAMTDGYAVVERRGAYPESSSSIYGLGLRTKSYQGHEIVSHGGDIPGYGSQLMWNSQAGIGIVVLTNMAVQGNYLADSICYRILEELLPSHERRLERVDWTTRFQRQFQQRRESLAKAVAQARSRVLAPDHQAHSDLERYIGTYEDPSAGYHDLRIRVVRAASDNGTARHSSVVDDSPGPLVHVEQDRDHLWIDWPGFFGAKGIALYPVATASGADDQPNGATTSFSEEWTGLFVNAFDESLEIASSASTPASSDSVRLQQYWDRPVTVRFDGPAGDDVATAAASASTGGGFTEVTAMRIWGIWGAGAEQSKKEERGDWGREEILFVKRPTSLRPI